jgi:hypothetical protein
MSDRITQISLPGAPDAGIGEWGNHTAEFMIFQYRAYAKHLRAHAEAIEAAADHEFQVEIVLGSLVQKPVKTMQVSSRKAHGPLANLNAAPSPVMTEQEKP